MGSNYDTEKNQQQKGDKLIEERIKEIKVGIVNFKYDSLSKKERQIWNEFVVCNQKMKKLSDRVLHKINKNDYCSEEIKKAIITEYDNENKSIEFHEEWFTFGELLERFKADNIKIVDCEIKEL